MLVFFQELLGGESWIVVEIAVEKSLIDADCAVEKMLPSSCSWVPEHAIDSENMYHVP